MWRAKHNISPVSGYLAELDRAYDPLFADQPARVFYEDLRLNFDRELRPRGPTVPLSFESENVVG